MSQYDKCTRGGRDQYGTTKEDISELRKSLQQSKHGNTVYCNEPEIDSSELMIDLDALLDKGNDIVRADLEEFFSKYPDRPLVLEANVYHPKDFLKKTD